MPADPRPSTVTIRLTPALYARALAAGMPEGERDLGEWLVSRAEAAETARADALEEAARECEGLGRDFAEAFPEQDRRTISVVRATFTDAALNIRTLAKKEAP